MATRDPALESATLRAELDLRWPNATGAARATTDEQHRLVLVHPQYDGFVTLEVAIRADVDGVFVLPDEHLARLVTAHHRTGPLQRGQVLPIDLELHPGNAARPASDGRVRLVDSEGDDVAPPVRITIACDPALDCVLAGRVDGPFATRDTFTDAVDDLLQGRVTVRRTAQRVTSLHDGESDPGIGRGPRTWRKRR